MDLSNYVSGKYIKHKTPIKIVKPPKAKNVPAYPRQWNITEPKPGLASYPHPENKAFKAIS